MYKGIGGLIKAFRECIDREEGKIAFIGSVGVCTPFAELLAYSLREKRFEMVYIPNAEVEEARKMKLIEGVGYQVVDEKVDPEGCDFIVVLGGLAVPKYPTTPEDVLNAIEKISRNARVIGFGFMGIFEKSRWKEKIDFNMMIDGKIEAVKR